jgi:hypothetical protein
MSENLAIQAFEPIEVLFECVTHESGSNDVAEPQQCRSDDAAMTQRPMSRKELENLTGKSRTVIQDLITKYVQQVYPFEMLRTGESTNTIYTALCVECVLELLDYDSKKQPRSVWVSNRKQRLISQHQDSFDVTSSASISALANFNQQAASKLATTDTRINLLRQEAQAKMRQLQQLYQQLQDTEELELQAQEKDREATEAQWELECVEEVMREEIYKKTRKREIKESLKNRKK